MSDTGPARAGLRRAGRRPALARAVAVALALAAAAAAPARQASEPPRDAADLARAVKATFLYKFAPFVEWPAATFQTVVDPFRLCVVGDAELAAYARRGAAGQRVGTRPIVVDADPPSAAACQILYLGIGADDPEEWLEESHGLPVLTVTDEAAGERQRGVVHFVLYQDRVRFEIDEGLAHDGGLRISSSVLALALRVER